MRAGRTLASFGIALAFVAAGCGGSMSAPPDLRTLEDLEEARVSGSPYFFLGNSFAGLPLTHVDSGPGGAAFIYGDCEADLWSTEPSCPPPLQVQNKICDRRTVLVAVFGVAQLDVDAAEALQPLNAAARTVRKPYASIDYMPQC